jgi:deoxyribodipyrimidine photolyase
MKELDSALVWLRRDLRADDNAALGVFAADLRDGYYLSDKP